ncbi:MAG: hypothetical protein ACFE95_23195 [Candidatus Hodarchaeota archaeon]
MGEKGKLRFDLKFDEQWQELITSSEIDECREIGVRRERIDFVLDFLDRKMHSLRRKEPSPMLTILALPMEIIRMCKKPEQKGYHITITDRRFKKELTPSQLEGDYDFHNIIKVVGMKHKMPTQLILPPTLDVYRVRGVQDLATRAWNLSVALYYKVYGIPWKIAQLEPGTCYAGISFCRELDEDGIPSMRASIAHLFLHTGECLILTGEPFKWDEPNVSPRLTEEQSQTIRENIVNAYRDTHGVDPKRLVIHKKSKFTPQEHDGFLSKKGSIKQTDLLTISISPADWFREGKYPTVRGMVLKCPGPEYLVFTLGFIPSMNTFPKGGIPKPIRIRPYNLDSTDLKMCKEILSLSKLNWNNADFCDQFPITISASEMIGEILSESRARNIEPSEEFRYYM